MNVSLQVSGSLIEPVTVMFPGPTPGRLSESAMVCAIFRCTFGSLKSPMDSQGATDVDTMVVLMPAATSLSASEHPTSTREAATVALQSRDITLAASIATASPTAASAQLSYGGSRVVRLTSEVTTVATGPPPTSRRSRRRLARRTRRATRSAASPDPVTDNTTTNGGSTSAMSAMMPTNASCALSPNASTGTP